MSEQEEPKDEQPAAPAFIRDIFPTFEMIDAQKLAQEEEATRRAQPVSITQGELDDLRAQVQFYQQQTNVLGGLCRVLLAATGGALCYNRTTLEDSIDAAMIVIRPSRQALNPAEILDMIAQGIDLDKSFIASIQDRPPADAAQRQAARAQARKKERAEEHEKRRGERVKGKSKLVLLGSSEGEKLD